MTGTSVKYRIGKPVLGGLAALVLAACTTTPERLPELEQARASVESLRSQPNVRRAASTKLTDAEQALRRAETALEEGEPVELIRHEAYLARRHAEIGLEMTSEAEATQALTQAEARRNEVQLQARTLEAERAERLAMQREREAEASQSTAQAAISEASRLAEELNLLEGELAAKQTERGLVLTLGDVLFDTGQAELKPGAEASIGRLAAFLEENTERRLLIEGHTDSRGSDALNRDLSAKRADAVTEALVQRGVPRDRLRSVGLGEAYPVASNDSQAGMQQNRRVEIVVSNSDGSFPAEAEERAIAARQR